MGNNVELNQLNVWYNIVLFDIQEFLWDKIKNKFVNWFYLFKLKKKLKIYFKNIG